MLSPNVMVQMWDEFMNSVVFVSANAALALLRTLMEGVSTRQQPSQV